MINNVYVNNDGEIKVRKGYLEYIFPKGVYKSPDDKLVEHSEEVKNSDKKTCPNCKTIIIE